MKHANNRRSRSRGNNNKRYPNQKGGVFESNGPDVKIRGTPHQVHEKYLGLARDATSTGDRVTAEAYFQYAEHYYRIMNLDQANGGANRGGRGNQNQQQQRQNVDPAEAEQPDLSPPSADAGKANSGDAKAAKGAKDGDDAGVVVDIAAAEQPKAPKVEADAKDPESAAS